MARSRRLRNCRLTPEPGGGSIPGGADRGAAAVEFALLLPLLMLFLFGIIQYGYGLFQLQAFSSSLGDATELASTGISDCAAFPGVLKGLADGNGLDPAKVTDVKVKWQTDSGAANAIPTLLGRVQVTATFAPFKIGIPFVPFPSTITRTQTATIQSVSLASTGYPVSNCGTP